MFEPGAGRDTARLEDYLQAVKDHKLLVVASIVAVTALAYLGAGSRPETYTATATVAVAPTPVGAAVPNNLERPNLELERAVVGSNATAQTAITSNGLDIERDVLLEDLSVDYLPDSNVLNVSYTSRDPDRAALLANAVARTYVDTRDGASLSFYRSQLAELQGQQALLQSRLDTLYTQITNVEQFRAGLLALPVPTPEEQAELQRLTDELASTRDIVDQTLAEQRDLSTRLLASRQNLTGRSPAATLLRTAAPPTAPAGISTGLITVGGLLFGTFLGIGAAFLAQRLNGTAGSETDVSLALGASPLGSIPRLGLLERRRASLVMLSDDGSARVRAARESFRRLSTSVQFLRTSEGIQSLLVTSAGPSEGKSTTAANLSLALARSGLRVVLISADLRRPSQEERFGVPAEPGLSEFLAGDGELVAHEVGGLKNLWLIPSGAVPSNPGELMSSDLFGKLIAEVIQDVDIAIVDTPPVLNTADASAAVRHVDGAIVVVDTRHTETAELLQARADLQRSGGRIVGAVLNQHRWRHRRFRRDRYATYKPSSPVT